MFIYESNKLLEYIGGLQTRNTNNCSIHINQSGLIIRTDLTSSLLRMADSQTVF